MLEDIQHYPQLMAAFESSWVHQLLYDLIVELDMGLTDETAVQYFLKVIELTRARMAAIPDPVPGELSRKLARELGVFQDQEFGAIDQSRIVDALNDLDQLIRSAIDQLHDKREF